MVFSLPSCSKAVLASKVDETAHRWSCGGRAEGFSPGGISLGLAELEDNHPSPWQQQFLVPRDDGADLWRYHKHLVQISPSGGCPSDRCGRRCRKASLMISSRAAVAARWLGVFHNRFRVFFFSSPSPYTRCLPFLLTLSAARAEYSVLCWITRGRGTFVKKESEKNELLSHPIPKSENKRS